MKVQSEVFVFNVLDSLYTTVFFTAFSIFLISAKKNAESKVNANFQTSDLFENMLKDYLWPGA